MHLCCNNGTVIATRVEISLEVAGEVDQMSA